MDKAIEQVNRAALERLIDETLNDTRFVSYRENREIVRNQLRVNQEKAITLVCNIRMLPQSDEAEGTLRDNYDTLKAIRAGISRLGEEFDDLDKKVRRQEEQEKREEERKAKAERKDSSPEDAAKAA